jgi:hypothetical protein
MNLRTVVKRSKTTIDRDGRSPFVQWGYVTDKIRIRQKEMISGEHAGGTCHILPNILVGKQPEIGVETYICSRLLLQPTNAGDCYTK